MLAFLLLFQATTDALPPLPTDWSRLAPIPYVDAPTITAPLVKFVAGEVAAGRCAMQRPSDGHYVVKVDVAALVDQDGILRRAVPRAIDCPTVEQYSAGLVTNFARANLSDGPTAMWYRATLVYDWQG